MELKRILARDARAANEKAIAQFGSDVMIISSSQVNGMTELIVAVDLPPMPTEEAEPYLKPEFSRATSTAPKGKFDVLLGQNLENNKRVARQSQATQTAQPIVEVKPQPKAAFVGTKPREVKLQEKSKTEAMEQQQAQQLAQQQDSERVREVVAQVREELASLRREFKLSQQVAAWQGGMPLHPALSPLRDALNDAPIPVALRALLIDSIKDFDNLNDALAALKRQLAHTIEQQTASAPKSGVHVLAGPSGAGKSMMVARLAHAAAQQAGSEKILVVSFHDQRAGAWSQTQLLCAHSGVDCVRATSAGTLKLLLEENEGRQLILIDTPGVQMNERLADIRAVAKNVEFHAVVPADSSSATIRRVFENTDNAWSSLMLSKLDESSQPWALLQFLSDRTMTVSVASQGERAQDLVQEMNLADLVDCALEGLGLAKQNVNPDRESALSALAGSKLSEISSRIQNETQA
jgi:flagellar biosynthesis protein FlhF